MKRISTVGVVAVTLLVSAAGAWADIVPPPGVNTAPAKPPATTPFGKPVPANSLPRSRQPVAAHEKGETIYVTDLTVAPQAEGRSAARLQISEALLKELQAAAVQAAAAKKSGKAEGPGSAPGAPAANAPGNGSGVAAGMARSATTTIVSGLFLCLAFSFAGVWLARSTARPRRKATVAVVLGLGLVGATVTLANANMPAPHFYAWTNLSSELNAGRATTGRVQVEIVPDGSPMVLVVPSGVTRRFKG